MKASTMADWLSQFRPDDDIPFLAMEDFYGGDFGISPSHEGRHKLLLDVQPKAATYGDLPQSPSMGTAIFCMDGCDEGYAASRGDYFMCEDSEPIVCGVCGGPMFLGYRVTVIVPID